MVVRFRRTVVCFVCTRVNCQTVRSTLSRCLTALSSSGRTVGPHTKSSRPIVTGACERFGWSLHGSHDLQRCKQLIRLLCYIRYFVILFCIYAGVFESVNQQHFA